MKLFHRIILGAVAAGLLLSAPAPAATTQGSRPGAESGPAATTTVATANVAYAGTIYLTFDDGPSVYTARVLAILRKYGIKAVFFEVGQNVERYPATMRSVRAAGHLIGNHTWSHLDLTTLSTTSVTWQLNRMEQTIGYRPRCVRPPYGATSSRIASIIANRGQRQILWTVDPRDWSRPGTSTIVNRVLAQVGPGARILMHDGGGDRSQTVAALDILVPKLRARGYVIGLMAC